MRRCDKSANDSINLQKEIGLLILLPLHVDAAKPMQEMEIMQIPQGFIKFIAYN